MKICPLCELAEENFVLKNISSIYQIPAYRSLNSEKRICNGFIAVASGKCVYTWSEGSETLSAGDIMYLPLESKHKMQVKTEDFSFYRIDFTILTPEGETVIFSKTPQMLYRGADTMTMNIIKEMTELLFRGNVFFRLNALLFELFDEIEKKSDNRTLKTVIEYINNNFTKPISTEELESLCNLSRAQMYRIFKKEMGMSPVEYRNSLRIESAKTLLYSEECSVGEISEMLGFESIYYFDRVFKKFTGYSPGNYIKNKRNNKKA